MSHLTQSEKTNDNVSTIEKRKITFYCIIMAFEMTEGPALFTLFRNGTGLQVQISGMTESGEAIGVLHPKQLQIPFPTNSRYRNTPSTKSSGPPFHSTMINIRTQPSSESILCIFKTCNLKTILLLRKLGGKKKKV